MISIDSETTGLDLRHGARPFFVVSADEAGEVSFWQWDVDPLTREPVIPDGDLAEIGEMIFGPAGDDGPGLVLQNSKFDVTALATVMPPFAWPWQKTDDTLIAGHMLESAAPHDLTSMALRWLGKDIKPFEDRLKEETNAARRIARSKFPSWRIARRGLEEMPSAKDAVWHNDTWLPRALALHLEIEDGHPWWTVLSEYACVDAEVTLALWKVQRAEIERKGLEAIYEERKKLVRIAHEMESAGLTVSRSKLAQLRAKHRADSKTLAGRCSKIARELGYDLELPKGSNNTSLSEFCFGRSGDPNDPDPVKAYAAVTGKDRQEWLRLPPHKWTPAGKPSLDKESFEHWLETLDPNSTAYQFVEALSGKRKRDTALTFLESYERFAAPEGKMPGRVPGFIVLNGKGRPIDGATGEAVHDGEWFRLHPNLNITGTAHLRWSCNNPNAQQISKQEIANLRLAFGPALGREWWSLDFANLELRIPTYEANEPELVAVFDEPKRPPFYGSYHLVVFAAVWPELWESAVKEHGLEGAADFVKSAAGYESTQYQWIKNFDFGVIYGCQEAKGDATAHRRGAWRANRARFPKIAALSDSQIAIAERRGFVETLPDRTVDPSRGYPIMCVRSEEGRIKPTLPLNYHVSGTACWVAARAMVKVDEVLGEWRRDGFDGRMVLQVHDELVFDLPRGRGAQPWKTNLPRMRAIKAAMESCGEDLIPRVPTPCSMEYHDQTWARGMKL